MLLADGVHRLGVAGRLATLDHGDTVLVPNPSYPIHIYGAVIAGAQVRSVPLVDGVDFFGELERAIRETIPRPKMMILGSQMQEQEVKKIIIGR